MRLRANALGLTADAARRGILGNVAACPNCETGESDTVAHAIVCLGNVHLWKQGCVEKPARGEQGYKSWLMCRGITDRELAFALRFQHLDTTIKTVEAMRELTIERDISIARRVHS